MKRLVTSALTGYAIAVGTVRAIRTAIKEAKNG